MTKKPIKFTFKETVYLEVEVNLLGYNRIVRVVGGVSKKEEVKPLEPKCGDIALGHVTWLSLSAVDTVRG